MKWIEFDPPDACLLCALRGKGFDRYLAVVSSERKRVTIGELCPKARSQIAVNANSRRICNNNADVLILSNRPALALWRFRNFGHAKYVAWRPSWRLAACVVALACLMQILLRRIFFSGVVSFEANGAKRRLLLFRIRRPRSASTARRYVPHALGVGGLIARLQAQKVSYAVLRWFESLPALPAGEDLDLLVDDAALEAVHGLLNEG